MSKDKDPIILNYYDSLLRQSDIDLLNGPHWLNDNIISFYFEYLTKCYSAISNMVLFVSPEVTQCIKISQVSQIHMFLDPLDFDRKKFIFFALNDNESTQFAGGSHWSLLVFSRAENMMFHYDSLRSHNQEKQAYSLGRKLFRYCNMMGAGEYRETFCPSQTNVYDCGIHLICNAEQIAEWISRNPVINTFCPNATTNVANKRLEILDIINELKNKVA